MACDCLEKSKEQTLEHLKTQNEGKKLVLEGNYNHTTFLYDAKPSRTQLYHEFEYTYKPWKVNGDLGQERKSILSVLPTFCGFCGKKYEETEELAG